MSAALDTGPKSSITFLKVTLTLDLASSSWTLRLKTYFVHYYLHFTEKPWSSGDKGDALSSGILYVKRKVGACSYADDPAGCQSLLSRAMHKVSSLLKILNSSLCSLIVTSNYVCLYIGVWFDMFESFSCE